MRRLLFLLLLLSASLRPLLAANDTLSVCTLDMKSEMNLQAWLLLRRGFEEAKNTRSDLIILHINTYGGPLDIADSMRSLILNSPIPVWAFIDNQAASAGALIALACDSIYMREGASMGAATVVIGNGTTASDKHQSFMRSMMRSTAQAKGKYWTQNPSGDSIEVYRRSPDIAQSMVDPDFSLTGVSDSGHVLTLTAHEAVALGMCEGIHENIEQILQHYNISANPLQHYRAGAIDRLNNFMINPIVSGILIMLIIGGLYFELQSPGVGFPLIISILAAIAYFTPLYANGLVQYIDIVLFLTGIVLILIEVFAIPGFGLIGILGIASVISGLSLALLNNDSLFLWEEGASSNLIKVVAIVLGALTLGIIGSIVLSGFIISSPRTPAFALRKNLNVQDGYVGVGITDLSLVGRQGTTHTVLRPSGKVLINDCLYDAISDSDMIEKGCEIEVTRIETNQVYVRKIGRN